MNERFAEAMRHPRAAKDTRLLGDFAAIYCEGVHGGVRREALVSDGVELGAYGPTAPVVCGECAELLRYAERRRAYCPKDPKPFCNYCDTHCYRPDMRERVREMMRYAGPRSWKHGYAIEGIRHAIEGKRYRREMERRTAEETRETP